MYKSDIPQQHACSLIFYDIDKTYATSRVMHVDDEKSQKQDTKTTRTN